MLLFTFACTLPGLQAPPEPPAPPTPEEAAPAATTSAVDVMDRMSRHAGSLFFAGQTGETALARWEITQLRDQIKALDGITVNNVDLGKAAADSLTGPLAGLEAATTPGEYETAYTGLVAGCNACHAQTGVAFIEITLPRNPPWSNVKYGNMGRGGMGMGAGPGMGAGAGMGAGRGPGAAAAEGGAPAAGVPAEGADGARQGRPRRQGGGPRGGPGRNTTP